MLEAIGNLTNPPYISISVTMGVSTFPLVDNRHYKRQYKHSATLAHPAIRGLLGFIHNYYLVTKRVVIYFLISFLAVSKLI